MSSNRLRVLLVSLLAVFAVSAVASASSASAFNLQWDVCETGTKGVEPPTKFDDHGCSTKAKPLAEREWEWKILAATETRKVISNIKPGTTFVLKALNIVVTCKSATDTGTITGGTPGTDETTVTYDECTTSIAGCKVKSATKPAGEILVSNIKTKLVEGETKAGVKVVADEFFKAGEFVTLEFGEVEKGTPPTSTLEKACPKIPLTTKVTGKIYAIAQEPGLPLIGLLKFPTGGLKTPVNTLNVFGVGAELTGEEQQTLENGWAVTAI